MNNMAWRALCAEFFSQYKELLEDFNYSLEEFKETLNALEQCVDFKEYEELLFLLFFAFNMPKLFYSRALLDFF